MNRALDHILSQPWAIQPDWLEVISGIAQREGDIHAVMDQREQRFEALDAMPGDRLEGATRVRVRDGVAIVQAIGPLIRYGNLFSMVSGTQSLQMLAQDFRTALESPEVQAIILYADGPGGQAAGIHEFANQVFDARAGDKPVVAYVAGMAASAHYWFTSAASEIVIDATAELGSIGVVFGYTDYSEADKKAGRKRIEVVSSRAPLKRAAPTEEKGLQEIQARANAIEEVFLQSVARNRGVTVETVASDFGQGGILVGQAAVEAGIADRLGDFESLLTELAGSASNHQRSYFMSKSNHGAPAAEKTGTVTLEASPITVESVKFESPEVAAALIKEGEDKQAAAYGEIKKSGEDIQSEATKAERTRISTILDLAGANLSDETAKAIKDGDTPEAYAMAAMKAARERGVSLTDIAADSTEAPPDPKGNQEASASALWDASIPKE